MDDRVRAADRDYAATGDARSLAKAYVERARSCQDPCPWCDVPWGMDALLPDCGLRPWPWGKCGSCFGTGRAWSMEHVALLAHAGDGAAALVARGDEAAALAADGDVRTWLVELHGRWGPRALMLASTTVSAFTCSTRDCNERCTRGKGHEFLAASWGLATRPTSAAARRHQASMWGCHSVDLATAVTPATTPSLWHFGQALWTGQWLERTLDVDVKRVARYGLARWVGADAPDPGFTFRPWGE